MKYILLILAFTVNYVLFAWLCEDLNPFAWGAVPYMIWCGVMVGVGLLVVIKR